MRKKIKDDAQIMKIEKNTLLLKYPLRPLFPETLDSDNYGTLYIVTEVSQNSCIIRIVKSSEKSEVQIMLENNYLSPIRFQDLKDGTWYL